MLLPRELSGAEGRKTVPRHNHAAHNKVLMQSWPHAAHNKVLMQPCSSCRCQCAVTQPTPRQRRRLGLNTKHHSARPPGPRSLRGGGVGGVEEWKGGGVESARSRVSEGWKSEGVEEWRVGLNKSLFETKLQGIITCSSTSYRR